jgi:hypothetical protein
VKSAKITYKRFAVVWNKKADGLRAFGFDFGPFALVVLRDAK